MRVAFAIGRPDPVFDPLPAAKSAEDDVAYWTSSILKNLRQACAERKWDQDMLLIGQEGGQRVKPPDVVVNLISEPLVCQNALAALAQNAERHNFKILNTPAATMRASRTILPTLQTEGVDIPLTTWCTSTALAAHIETVGHSWPLLLRPPGSHGSSGLRKIDGVSGLPTDVPPGGCLVTDFRDFKSNDGLYRKHRMVRVGKRIFRRHLIVADHWNITGASRAFMVGKDALIAEEKAFLAGNGGRAERAVAPLFDAVGLDFGLVDYARDAKGNVIVFELNGCFQITGSIPKDKMERWGYLEESNGAILDAIMNLIADRTAANR